MNSFVKNNKFAIILFIIFSAMTVYMWQSTPSDIIPDKNTDDQDDLSTSSLTENTDEQTDGYTKNSYAAIQKISIQDSTTSTENEVVQDSGSTLVSDGIEITLIVERDYNQVTIPKNLNVYDAMEYISKNADWPLDFEAKEYGNMGYLIEEINDIPNNIKNNTFWFWYLNGEPAKSGISQYIIQKGDIIEWKYETATF